MLASSTGLSWSKRFGIVQGIAYQSAAVADGQMTLWVEQGTGQSYRCVFISRPADSDVLASVRARSGSWLRSGFRVANSSGFFTKSWRLRPCLAVLDNRVGAWKRER